MTSGDYHHDQVMVTDVKVSIYLVFSVLYINESLLIAEAHQHSSYYIDYVAWHDYDHHDQMERQLYQV